MTVFKVITVLILQRANVLLIVGQSNNGIRGSGSGIEAVKRVFVIVRILEPVSNSILGILVCLPLGIQSDALGQDLVEAVGSGAILIGIPAPEHIAGTGGGILTGIHGKLVAVIESGIHEAAALGIEGDGEGGDGDGVQDHIAVGDGDSAHSGSLGIGLHGGQAPAGDRQVLVVQHDLVAGSIEAAAGDHLTGLLHTALLIGEEQIVHLGVLSLVGPGLGGGDGSGALGEAGFAQVPAVEAVAVLLGSLGGEDGLAVLHLLGADHSAVSGEGIGGDGGGGRQDLIGIHALGATVVDLHIAGLGGLRACQSTGIGTGAVGGIILGVHHIGIAGDLIHGEGDGLLGLLLSPGVGIDLVLEGQDAAHVGRDHHQGGGQGGGLGALGGIGGLTLGGLGHRRLGGLGLSGVAGLLPGDDGGVGDLDVQAAGLGRTGEGGDPLARLILHHLPAGDREGIALHIGDDLLDGQSLHALAEGQSTVGQHMAGLALIGVDSGKHHSQGHFLSCGRICRIGGIGGIRSTGGVGNDRGIGDDRGVGGTGGLRGSRGSRCFGGGTAHVQGLSSAAALLATGGSGGLGGLLAGPLTVAGQQPARVIQDAGGQDDRDRHDQGQESLPKSLFHMCFLLALKDAVYIYIPALPRIFCGDALHI